ncbi:MAG: cytochrome c biogenesis protein CcsA [Anaerolineales bacterium]|nr:cytochrome c biogenesis protein CcsA [Anaerolineales bacterium]MCW5856499.1 cytochrome c biogenesis protein CcsA [Anaerolineales bacterium]
MATKPSESKPFWLRVLDIASLVFMAVATWMVFFYAPREAVMGEVQRVFYFHVATGWVGMAAFIVAAIAGIVYLIRPNRKWDILAVAAVELGLVYGFLNVATGSIWARPAWNTWWTWDPRLVTASIMLLTFLAYLLLRQSIEDPDRRARFGAIYAILASLTVPLTYYSIRIWRTLHPVVIGSGDPNAEGGFAMTTPMLHTLLFSVLAFTVLGITLLWHLIRLGQLGDRVEQLRVKWMGN